MSDINPNKVPLGKTHFQNVLQLVVERCQQIKREHLILNWHHSLLYAFKFLMFYRIWTQWIFVPPTSGETYIKINFWEKIHLLLYTLATLSFQESICFKDKYIHANSFHSPIQCWKYESVHQLVRILNTYIFRYQDACLLKYWVELGKYKMLMQHYIIFRLNLKTQQYIQKKIIV